MNAAATRLLQQETCIWLDRSGHLRSLDLDSGNVLEAVVGRLAGLCDKPDAGCGDDSLS